MVVIWGNVTEHLWSQVNIAPGWCRQPITSTSVDPNLCRHMASVGHSELTCTRFCYALFCYGHIDVEISSQECGNSQCRSINELSSFKWLMSSLCAKNTKLTIFWAHILGDHNHISALWFYYYTLYNPRGTTVLILNCIFREWISLELVIKDKASVDYIGNMLLIQRLEKTTFRSAQWVGIDLYIGHLFRGCI